MHFKSIEINEWQQFERVNIEFHDRLTILTGANGSGKTTILNILAKYCDWTYSPLATPKSPDNHQIDKGGDHTIGYIGYSNSENSELQISTAPRATQYSLKIPRKASIRCCFLPSHRSAFQYKKVGSIPTDRKEPRKAFNETHRAILVGYIGGSTDSPSFFVKNTLIGWAIQGYGVQGNGKIIMHSDHAQVSFFEGFRDILKQILPSSLGFQALEIREMELVFICNDGRDEFILETASGGISSLIELAWQIYTFSMQEEGEFTVLIDEVENHLHPTMQRRILYDLVNAFPQARFIVTTHSPLVVSSVKDSSVYALRYNDRNKIESHKLDLLNKAKTAQEILDEVLGVSFTMPIWVEEQLGQIVQRYAAENMNEVKFSQMRADLKEIGLERLMPTAIQSVVEQEPS